MRRMLFTLFAAMSVAVLMTGCELGTGAGGKEVKTTAESFGAEIAKEDYKAARAFLEKDFIWFDSAEKQHGSTDGKSGKTSFLSMLNDAKSGGSFLLTVDLTTKISDTRYVAITTATVPGGTWQIRLSFAKAGDAWELVEAKELSARPKGGKPTEIADPSGPGSGSGARSDVSNLANEAGNGAAPGAMSAKRSITDKLKNLPGSAGAGN